MLKSYESLAQSPTPRPQGYGGKMAKENRMKNVDWKTVRFLEKKALDINPAKHFNPWKYCKELEEKMQQIKSTRNCKYMLNFHIVWCLRGRVKILFHEARVLLREAIEAVCVENKWTPYAIEPMPDHVHIFLGAKTFHEDVLGSLKEQTSSFLKQCFSIYSNALTDERFWSGSYYRYLR